MEIDQIIKRLDWLDEERRKDKTTIANLEAQLSDLRSNLPTMIQQIKEMSSELTRISTQLSRFDQIEASMVQIRVDLSRSIEEIEKKREEKERDMERQRLADYEQLTFSLGEVRKGLSPIPELKRDLQTRTEEDYRLGRLIEELEGKIQEVKRSDEDIIRSQRLLDEGRRQDSKRLVDAQGELTTLRKRLDEQRGRLDLVADSVRKFDSRINELLAMEAERKQNQNTFMEKQSKLQVERDRIWKDWEARFQFMNDITQNIEAQLQAMENTHRAARRSKEELDEATQRFERRINEITEMQRLSDERFRQEWVTFKGDDQKRWTNYLLAQEEKQRDFDRRLSRFEGSLDGIQKQSQDVMDRIADVRDSLYNRYKTLLSLAQNWVDDHEETFGKPR